MRSHYSNPNAHPRIVTFNQAYKHDKTIPPSENKTKLLVRAVEVTISLQMISHWSLQPRGIFLVDLTYRQ